MRKTAIIGVSFLAVLGALLPACSSEDPAVAADNNVVVVTASANSFEPASVTIKVGQTVRWQWAGGSHNVVSGPDCGQADGNFRSGAPQEGGTFEKQFEKAGSFPYNCEVHCKMGMKGDVIVE
jgi:plastocyanin